VQLLNLPAFNDNVSIVEQNGNCETYGQDYGYIGETEGKELLKNWSRFRTTDLIQKTTGIFKHESSFKHVQPSTIFGCPSGIHDSGDGDRQ
jgi:hypothetical protein